LLGGLLGGVFSTLASRWLPGPATSAAAIPVPAEARATADAYVARLRAGKYDEFVNDLKNGMVFPSEKEFDEFRRSFELYRTVIPGIYGPLSGDVTLVRESAATPDLARFVYLQKCPNGLVVWTFIMYRGAEGWRPSTVSWSHDPLRAFPGP
jgi:hypothetical protein